MSKYRTSWSEIQEQMNEFALSHTVRYRDPLNKKRFAVPFKTAEKAKEKMDQLKRDGVKEIEITKDVLRGKFKEGVIPNTQSAKNKLYKDYIKQGKHPDAAAELVGNAVAEGTIVEELDKDDEKDVKKVISKLNKASDAHAGQAKTLTKALKEDGHEDVSSSKRMAQVIAEDAQLILQELNKKSDEETLPTWWTNKLATSAHNMNAARDYITNDIKEDLEEAISPEQLKRIRDQYKEIKTISPEKVKTLRNFLDRYSTDTLMQLAQAGINFVSTMARSVMNK